MSIWPLELILEKDYEKHLLECKSRPNITAKEEEEIEKAKVLNDIATERQQIQQARQKYYKGCVEEPEIPGLGKTKQKKKKNKKLKAKFNAMNKKEEDRIVEMAEHTNGNEIDDNEHEIKDFEGDCEFELEKEEEKEQNFKKLEQINEKKIKEDDKNGKIKSNKKEDVHMESIFYDPNKEDEDINQNSANIIVPDSIYKILEQY